MTLGPEYKASSTSWGQMVGTDQKADASGGSLLPGGRSWGWWVGGRRDQDGHMVGGCADLVEVSQHRARSLCRGVGQPLSEEKVSRNTSCTRGIVCISRSPVSFADRFRCGFELGPRRQAGL
jgi:hypothetical protein